MSPFQGVSDVSVAPVSLGNTVRSVKQRVVNVPGGVRIIGRDFVMPIGGTTSTYAGWCLQGGMAFSPISLNASGLRGYFQTYEEYSWNRADAHYITSSPTSTSGDVLMMYHRNHGGPKVNHSSTNFLSYALSTDSALIGPQWTNHSVTIINDSTPFLKTDVLNTEDVEHQAAGELLVYTKQTTNGTAPDSPGYLLVDYDIVFRHRMLNPRVATLPSGLFKWYPTGFQYSAAVTALDPVLWIPGTTITYNGQTGIDPPGTVIGDIFQVVFDIEAAIFGGTLAPGAQATMWVYNLGFTGNLATTAITTNIYPITTGTTLYAVKSTATQYLLYPSYEAVFAGNTLRWAAASVGLSFSCAVVLACVGSTNQVFQQANIG
jgi:hypothetical protein